jgi:hypothetical protein
VPQHQIALVVGRAESGFQLLRIANTAADTLESID